MAENRLDRLMGLAAVQQDEPAVEVIQPEVRTGSQYALLPSMRLDDEDEEED
jgi:hypothetical protein